MPLRVVGASRKISLYFPRSEDARLSPWYTGQISHVGRPSCRKYTEPYSLLPLALRRKLALENLNFGCSDHSMILFVVAAGKSAIYLIVGVVGRRGLVVPPHKY